MYWSSGDFRNAAWCPLDPVFPLSLPPSELHHTKEVGSRQYKEDLGGGVRRAGGDEIFCVLMQFFDESADRIRIEDLYSNTPPCDCDSGRDPLSLGT